MPQSQQDSHHSGVEETKGNIGEGKGDDDGEEQEERGKMLKKKEAERIADEVGSQFPQAIAQQLRHAFGGFGATSRVAFVNGI